MTHSRIPSVVAAVLAVCLTTRGVANTAVLLSFDAAKIGPSVACNGRVSVDGGAFVKLTPVLFEPGEGVSGNQWTCQTYGALQKPGGRGRVLTISRMKSVLVHLDAAADAVLRLETDLGDVNLRVSDLRTGAITMLEDRVVAMIAPDPAQQTTPETQDDFPDVTVTRDGTVWAGWQAWDDQGDCLRVARRVNGAWSVAEDLPVGRGDFFRLTLAPAHDSGAIWAVWSENRGKNWDLWACRRSDRWGKPIRLTDAVGADFNQCVAALPGGRVVVVWQRCVDGTQYDVFLAELTQSGLTGITRVTDHPANDWEPCLAVRNDGSLAVLWDTYRNGSYDVYMRRRSTDGTLGALRAVASSGNYEAHASASYDPQGRLWVAWDDGGPNWGKHGKPRPVIHRERRVKLACVLEDRVHTIPVPLHTCRTPDLQGMWELPRIAVDRTGHPVVLFRHLGGIRRWKARSKKPERQSRGIWSYFVTRFDGTMWSRPVLLVGSGGRNDQRVAVARGPDGQLWAAYAGDGRRIERAEVPQNNNVWVAHLPLPEQGSPVTVGDILAPEPKALSESPRADHVATVRGTSYSLVYGDTHRHTDISRCGMNTDGSLIDTYRYAIDATALDFLGIADHDQDILKHRYDRDKRPLQGYMWWRSEKFCDLFTMHPRFIALYGYEHGGSFKARGGHKNVMYSKRGNPCIEDDTPADLFKALEGLDAVAIPHQLADGPSATDWDRWDARWETVAEMFQARGSYEFMGAPRLARVQRPGHFVWDALAKGVKIGLIASSDHGMTHSAYACLYVRERSREGLIEALRKRRTFAATDTIVLEFSLGDAFMGEETETDQPPVLQAMIRGTSELDRVDVVRNNEFVYSVNPEGSEYRFTFTDTQLSKGQKAYYYVRCVQDNRELAWSSPIWVKWE